MTLLNILQGRVFRIPPENRGYVWSKNELKIFLYDLDSLANNQISNHYMGKIGIRHSGIQNLLNFETKKLEYYHIIDGHQRLFTCHMLLNLIIEFFEKRESRYFSDLNIDFRIRNHFHLHPHDVQKLDNFIQPDQKYNLKSKAVSLHQIVQAYAFLESFLNQKIKEKKEDAEIYMLDLLDALIRKLKFSVEFFSVESEQTSSYQLHLNKGKSWSSMDLLKTYFYHWITINCSDAAESAEMKDEVHEAWTQIGIYLENNEIHTETSLKIAWILNVNSCPKSWEGFGGFQSDAVIPLENFSIKNKEETRKFILNFSAQLVVISKHYSAIIAPENVAYSVEELYLLNQIKRTNNFLDYLPLMVASRIQCAEDQLVIPDYEKLLKAIEVLSYGLFPWEKERKQEILPKIYRCAEDVYGYKYNLNLVAGWIHGMSNPYTSKK